MDNDLVALNNEETQDDSSLYIFFTIADKIYAVEASYVIEVIMLPMIEIPQKMPVSIAGFMNYNSLTINVLNLRHILYLEQKQFNVNDRAIIIKTDEMIFAIVADNILDIMTVPAGQMEVPPTNTDKNYISMVYLYNESLAAVLDLRALEGIVKLSQLNNSHEGERFDLLPSDEASKNILQARAKVLLKKANSTPLYNFYSEDKYLIFSLSKNNYCINIKYVRELVAEKNIKITPLPFAPEYIQGVINLRGDFYTIINLEAFFNIGKFGESDFDSLKQIIVLDSEDYKMAILVDEIQSITDISNGKFINKSNSKFESKYTLADFIENDKVYSVINVEKFLNDEKLFINIES